MSIDQFIGHIGKVLVVDDEQSNLTLVKNYLKQQNQYDVHTFRNGEEAWDRLQATKFDFVIMGWRLKDVTAIAFLNRLRRLPNTVTLPVLVTSGMINRNDFRLLSDFPCTALLETPFSRGQFEKSLEHLIREKLWYQANIDIVRSLIENARGDGKQLDAQVKKILSSSPNPAPLAILAAKSMAAAGHYDEAKKALSAVLLKNPSNVAAINELAKIHCRHREYGKALDLLRHARDLSPQNMQRICMLGEVSLSLRDPEGAKRYFDEALEIDRKDEVAQAGKALSKNMLDFPANASGVAMTASFASLLNTIGISFVRNGKYEKGVEQYMAALMFLRENMDFAKVAFNLGLCYMRWGKRSDALPWFEKSHHFAGDLLKSGNYILSLKHSLKVKDSDPKGNRSLRIVDDANGAVSGFTFTEKALQNALGADKVKSPKSNTARSTVIKFDDDDLEERLGPTKGVALSKEAAEQVLNANLDEIENMDLADLDEIA